MVSLCVCPSSLTNIRNVIVSVTTIFERLGFHKCSCATAVLGRGEGSWSLSDLSFVCPRLGFSGAQCVLRHPQASPCESSPHWPA